MFVDHSMNIDLPLNAAGSMHLRNCAERTVVEKESDQLWGRLASTVGSSMEHRCQLEAEV